MQIWKLQSILEQITEVNPRCYAKQFRKMVLEAARSQNHSLEFGVHGEQLYHGLHNTAMQASLSTL